MPARTAWFGTFRSRSRRREHFLRRQPHWCPPRRDRPRAHDQRAQRICHRNARRHRSTIPQPTAARPAEGTREPNVATTPLPKSLTPSGHALTSTLMDAPPMRLNFAASLDRRPGRGGGGTQEAVKPRPRLLEERASSTRHGAHICRKAVLVGHNSFAPAPGSAAGAPIQHGLRAPVLRPTGDIIANRNRPLLAVRDRPEA